MVEPLASRSEMANENNWIPGTGIFGGIRELRSRHYRHLVVNVQKLPPRCRDPSQRCCSSRFPLHFPRTKKDPAHRPDHFFVVEVPGIEPGSLGEDLVILRAQFALAFLCPDVHANKMSTGTVTVRFSVRTRDRFRW